MSNPVFIYGLCDPRTGELRYVGKSKADRFKRRIDQHRSCARKGHQTHCYRWIKSLHQQGLEPEPFVIESCSSDSWQESERFWIGYFRMIGANLTNATSGGEGVEFTPEIRAKMSLKLKGKPGTRNGISVSEETRAKMRATALAQGRKFSPAAIEANRLARLGRKDSPETVQKKFAWRNDPAKESRRKERAADAHSKEYLLTSPEGEQVHVRGLHQFCKERGLRSNALCEVASGKHSHHKGWKAVRL